MESQVQRKSARLPSYKSNVKRTPGRHPGKIPRLSISSLITGTMRTLRSNGKDCNTGTTTNPLSFHYYPLATSQIHKQSHFPFHRASSNQTSTFVMRSKLEVSHLALIVILSLLRFCSAEGVCLSGYAPPLSLPLGSAGTQQKNSAAPTSAGKAWSSTPTQIAIFAVIFF